MNDKILKTEQSILAKEKVIMDREKALAQKIAQKKQNAVGRFPLLFTMLGAFGLVAVFYGFEHIIDQIDLLAQNPFILLGIGIAILAFTGTLYKRLG